MEEDDRTEAERLRDAADSEDPPQVVSLVDEESQANFDAQHIGQTLAEIRQLMAAAKVNKALAQRGLLSKSAEGQDLHPRKFDIAIARHREAIEVLKQLETQLGPTGLSESALEVPTGGIGDLTAVPSAP